jgi:hypothetical protein
VQALEGTEKLVRIAHIEAGAIIPDLVSGLAILDAAADGNSGVGSFCAVLQRVADEIAPDLANERGIGLDGG